MLVNNIDIASLNSRLLTKDIQTANVVTYDDWLRNSLKPIYMSKQEQYKQIKLKLYIKDIDEESTLTDISNLVKQFEQCTIKFDDLNYYYDCLLVSKTHERIAPGIYNLNIELKSGYAYKAEVIETLNHIVSKILNVPGNLATPAIVTMTVPLDTTSITLTGLGFDTITIYNLIANIPVIVDGESCKVMSNGLNKFLDTEMWNFPTLQPGANTINVSCANCVINISYQPQFI